MGWGWVPGSHLVVWSGLWPTRARSVPGCGGLLQMCVACFAFNGVEGYGVAGVGAVAVGHPSSMPRFVLEERGIGFEGSEDGIFCACPPPPVKNYSSMLGMCVRLFLIAVNELCWLADSLMMNPTAGVPIKACLKDTSRHPMYGPPCLFSLHTYIPVPFKYM